MNMQGTETVRVSMYANRYPYEKAFDLFGAVKDYGAQGIKQIVDLEVLVNGKTKPGP